MSNNYWDEDEDDDDTTQDVPMDGSDLLKKLRKAKRSDEKRIKELTDQLDEYNQIQREAIVESILETKGINLKAARLILNDLQDVSTDSVNDWLTDNGELFGMAQPQANPEQELNLAVLRQQDVVTQLGMTPDGASDLLNRINNAASKEELESLIYSQK